MFYPYAQCKSFSFYFCLLLIQHFEDITCRVAGGQYHLLCFIGIAAPSVRL